MGTAIWPYPFFVGNAAHETAEMTMLSAEKVLKVGAKVYRRLEVGEMIEVGDQVDSFTNGRQWDTIWPDFAGTPVKETYLQMRRRIK